LAEAAEGAEIETISGAAAAPATAARRANARRE
jgi:hypothetical protein